MVQTVQVQMRLATSDAPTLMPQRCTVYAASQLCHPCLQVVLNNAPTNVDADTYITPSSFQDAIRASVYILL